MTSVYAPPPTDFGLPAKFADWRDMQPQLFWDILDSKKRFSIHQMSVGGGKSLVYIAAAIAAGKRVAFLTESKGLQDQVSREFSQSGLFDMRGLANYNCKALEEGGYFEDMWSKRRGRPSCDLGPCGSGIRCDLKNVGCEYFDKYRLACSEQLVSTNFAYWMAIHRYGQGLQPKDKPFDWLVIDEAHASIGQLESAIAVEFVDRDFDELNSVPPKITDSMDMWKMWGRVCLNKVQGKLEFFKHSAPIGASDGTAMLIKDTDVPDASELKFWKRLEGKLTTLSDASDRWIKEPTERGYKISPIWVRGYAEEYLFRSVPRVIMLSATVRHKTMNLLGIPDANSEFKEYKSTFPVERRPIYWIPRVSVKNDNTPEERTRWLRLIDQILQRRTDRKGIIHTVSYELQKYLFKHSRFKDMMLLNTSGTTRDVVKLFKDSPEPLFLVSPSVGTGYDFPFDECRFQIIGKVPFRDPRGALMKAQSAEDPEYSFYLTAQDLDQMYGRPNRDERDFSETFVTDDNIGWFLKRCQRSNLITPYFMEAFQEISGVPDAPSLEVIAR